MTSPSCCRCSISRSSTATSSAVSTPSGDIRRPRLFGGQVAAQAARAASLTVPDDRSIHSLHGYFLRGRRGRPPDDPARRPRPRRPFVLGPPRHRAAGRQGDHEPAGVVPRRRGRARVPGDGTPRRRAACPRTSRRPRDGSRTSRCSTSASPAPVGHAATWGGPPHQFWARARGPLPDDRLLHACVLTYLSDVGHRPGEGAAGGAVVGTEPRPRGLVPPRRRDWTTGCSSTSCPAPPPAPRLLHRDGARPRRTAARDHRPGARHAQGRVPLTLALARRSLVLQRAERAAVAEDLRAVHVADGVAGEEHAHARPCRRADRCGASGCSG